MTSKTALALLLCVMSTAQAQPQAPASAPALAASAAQAPASAAEAMPSQADFDRAFDELSKQYIENLWTMDPESAIAAGRFEGAAGVSIPNEGGRHQLSRFYGAWAKRFGMVNEELLSPQRRADLALLKNHLALTIWQFGTYKEHEWNPAAYGIAGPIDAILNTDYEPKIKRLRTILQRIEHIPAYYEAARDSINNPTHEHTQLAIAQAPGNVSVLEQALKAANTSALTAAEKKTFRDRVKAGKAAIQGYVAFLKKLDAEQQASGKARSFRLGQALYDEKFKLSIQSPNTAEQTYQKALAARDALLTQMDGLADKLWPTTMGAEAKPADRIAKIGKVIDKLSAKHVERKQFFSEIRRQIPMLQDWVTQHGLLTLDPKKPLEVRETPEYERGVAGAGIEAPGPYRPQDRTYYNVTPLDGLSAADAESTLREYNHWILQILNIHEAIPGHYTQLVYANKSPSLVKSLFGNGAMVEGWAVYGERMMLEAGYGDNTPEMWLMWCKWNLRTVTNTILDYSVHTQNMSEAQALDLLQRQAFQTQREAREKWRRVQLTSVQLTSYFSGYSDIMALRDERKKALGDKFSLKQFHEDLLGYGSAPVGVIRDLMN